MRKDVEKTGPKGSGRVARNIIMDIFKSSAQPMSAYDVAKKRIDKIAPVDEIAKKAKSENKLNKLYSSTNYYIRVLEREGKLKTVGWAESEGSIKKRMLAVA